MTEWNRILENREYRPKQPDEIVISFACILEEREAKRILDLGCGAGRHTVYLAEQGFESYGADISVTGLKSTKQELRIRALEAEIMKCDMKSIPYLGSCFDAAVCVWTIYHQKAKEIRETISEIHRVLRRKGLLLANFHSKRSSKRENGIKVEENTFMQKNGLEKGVLHHFVDENELHELLERFEIVNLEARDKIIGDYLQSRFIVLAEKI
jgi:cyclopropane fatty-acyl-phospholipid synthase-like methyltransferase